MLKDQMTMIIHSCDKFSDLWEGHIKLLEQNWPDRGMKTLLVTDHPTERSFDRVSIIAAGADKEWSERFGYALEQVDTEYVFVTLDDYFLIKPVSTPQIQALLDMMDKERLDYVRLYLRPKCPKSAKMPEDGEVYRIDTSANYSVNLYAGIWRKSFLQQTIRAPKNAWQYEVSLPKIATEVGAKCAMSINREFVILDVVRKGKLLHRAAQYFKTHDVYHGDRPVISRWYEIKLGIRTWGVRLMPRRITNMARSLMIKLGHHYYSQDADT